MLTFYRILRKLFRRGRTLPEQIRQFDERKLIEAVGFWGLLPGGLILLLQASYTNLTGENLGTIIAIQGIALTLGGRLSRILQK